MRRLATIRLGRLPINREFAIGLNQYLTPFNCQFNHPTRAGVVVRADSEQRHGRGAVDVRLLDPVAACVPPPASDYPALLKYSDSDRTGLLNREDEFSEFVAGPSDKCSLRSGRWTTRQPRLRHPSERVWLFRYSNRCRRRPDRRRTCPRNRDWRRRRPVSTLSAGLMSHDR